MSAQDRCEAGRLGGLVEDASVGLSVTCVITGRGGHFTGWGYTTNTR